MSNPENTTGRTPFKDPLVESTISPRHKGREKLFDLESHPDKIIRMETFEKLEERYKGKGDPKTIAAVGKFLFTELQGSLGIVVPVEFVVGYSEKKKDGEEQGAVYEIVDKIQGENLVNVAPTPELAVQVAELYGRLAEYYLDKATKDELYIVDLHPAAQYVYGTRSDDPTPQLYLVDTDLFMFASKIPLFKQMFDLAVEIEGLEGKFKIPFTKAREALKAFLEEVVIDTTDEKARLEIEKNRVKLRYLLSESE
jgi:hypothetical protein